MVRPKKPTKVLGFLTTFYRCPYCKEEFSSIDIQKHIKQCFKRHRKEVRKMCSERGKRNFAEGKILNHIRRKEDDE